MARRIAPVERGAIVCGMTPDEVAEPVAALARATGWPVLADATSGVRCGRHDRSQVVAHYDVLLRSNEFAAACQPQLVLRIGDTPTSKSLRAWLAQSSQLLVDPHGVWHEPTRLAETVVRASPSALCATLAEALDEPDDTSWLRAWRAADELVPEALAATPDPFEPKAWTAVAASAPDDAVVWVASSMAIRDVESFFPACAKPLRLLANRGANGIDGTVAAAAGAALATGRPTYLLTGELALVHDVSGLLAAARLGADLTVVCTNNGGGGIFDFLPVAAAADPALYEEHIVTPSGVDLARLAALAGLEHVPVETPEEIADAAHGRVLIELRTNRQENVERHLGLVARVAERIGAATPR